MSQCFHKVPKEVIDEVRPEFHDARNEERASWSHGRPSANDHHNAAAKSNQRSSKSPMYSQPSVAAIGTIETIHPVHVAAEKAAAGSVVTICIGQVCALQSCIA